MYKSDKKEKMENQPMQQDPVNALLNEFGTRLIEIEEKQRLLKDRTLLIGENLISTKQEFEKDLSEIRNQNKIIEEELKSIKQLIKRIINEMDSFARKSELEILERQSKMFQPLELVKLKEVNQIVREELSKQKR